MIASIGLFFTGICACVIMLALLLSRMRDVSNRTLAALAITSAISIAIASGLLFEPPPEICLLLYFILVVLLGLMAVLTLLFHYQLLRRRLDLWFHSIAVIVGVVSLSLLVVDTGLVVVTLESKAALVWDERLLLFLFPAFVAYSSGGLFLLRQYVGMTNRHTVIARGVGWFIGAWGLCIVLAMMLIGYGMHQEASVFFVQYIPLLFAVQTPLLITGVYRCDYMSPDLEVLARSVFMEADDGIIICDDNHTVRHVNPKAVAILEGTDDTRILGRHLTDYLPTYRAGTVESCAEFAVYDAVHRHRQFAVRQSPIRRGSETVGALVTLQDITEERLAEESLKRSHRQFESEIQEKTEELVELEKHQATGAMAAAIAHDFNNLLAAIMGFATAVKLDLPSDSDIGKDVQGILDGSRLARNVINRLLTFSRPGGADRDALALRQIVDAATHLARTTLPAGVSLVTVGEWETVYVLGNSTDLQHALMNLITNAVQAIGEDNGTITVRIAKSPTTSAYVPQAVSKDTKGVFVEVMDNGTGMDKETRQLAFEPFFTTREESIGVGLPTVKQIAKEHCGETWLSPAAKTGTVATLWLPVLTCSEDTQPPHVSEWMSHGEHLLLVDDDPRLLRLGKRLLKGLGYRVTTYEEPSRALDALTRRPGDYDLLITDYHMPTMSGIELATAASVGTPGLPVILLTGNMSHDTVALAQKSGIRGVLRKPVALDELAGKTRRILDNRERISFSG